MSQENVEIAREIYRDWERGDFSASEWADPEIEVVLHSGPDEAVHRGTEEMGRAWAEWLRAWDEFRVEAREFIDLGDNVLVLVGFGGRGRTSGASIAAVEGGNLLSFRDGKVVRLETFSDRADALEAAGLSEQAMSQENVERVRQAYAAWNRGDLDTALSMMHPDAKWRTSGLFPDSDPVYRGRPAIRHWFETIREPWERFSAELVDVIPQGDTVVAEVVFKAVGRESATHVTLPFAHLFRFKAALVIEVSAYPSVEEALEAAELRE